MGYVTYYETYKTNPAEAERKRGFQNGKQILYDPYQENFQSLR